VGGAALLVVAGFVGAISYLKHRSRPAEVKEEAAEHKPKEERQVILPPVVSDLPSDHGKDDEARRQLEAERKHLQEERQKFEAAKLVSAGEKALAEKKYADAETAFTRALELDPENAAAKKGLTVAEAALLAAAKLAEDEMKRRAEHDRLMTDGRSALAAKKYAAAAEAFSAAAQLVPGDVEAGKLLAQAKDGLAAEKADKETAARYAAHMEAGRAAMIAMRYADALREFISAQKLMPDDAAAKKGREQAEARLDDIQDLQKRRDAFTALVDRGRAALQAARFDEAVASLEAALRLFQDEPTQQLLTQARQSAAQAKADYTRFMAQADAAARLGRYEEAVRAYTEALKAQPGDLAAERGLRALARLSDDFQAAQAAYVRYMTNATNLMQQGRFVDAQVAFNEALRVMPNDAQALQGVRDAQVAIDRALVDAQKREERRKAIAAGLQAANSALLSHKYDDAIKAANDVLRIDADNGKARALASQARFSQAMDLGRQAMNARRFADAERFANQALAEQPDDPAAKNLLQQARMAQGKK
jgi:tetratricopeptide (TPR) repeat protein